MRTIRRKLWTSSFGLSHRSGRANIGFPVEILCAFRHHPSPSAHAGLLSHPSQTPFNMHNVFDANEQPLPSFNAEARQHRSLSEMLGICKAFILDGIISGEEAEFLRTWIAANRDVVETWPGSVLSARLERIFADGRVGPEEQAELATLLAELVGGRASVAAGANLATRLPVDVPPPQLAFQDQVYVFTGMFAFGPRKECQRVVEMLGARCESGVTRRTTVVVIGTFASRDWIGTSHGTKILKAVEYRDRGLPISIVGEDHWVGALP